MKLNVTGPFTYFTIPILGGIPITQTTVSSLIVAVILIVASVVIGKRLKARPDGLQALVEKGVAMLYDMVGETMGEHNLHWTPFIGTIFLSSILGSLIGMTGFLRSSTADLSCVLVWSVLVTLIIWYNNIKRDGVWGWLKGFAQPIAVMTPMNIISEIAQPISMAFRHFGNVAGGGVITSILYLALSSASAMVLRLIASSGWLAGTVLILAGALLLALWHKNVKANEGVTEKKDRKHTKRWLILGCLCALLGIFGLLQAFGVLEGVPVLALGIPAVLSCYFDLFSGFVQAYVFTLLTMVYIGNSCPAPEEKKEAAQ